MEKLTPTKSEQEQNWKITANNKRAKLEPREIIVNQSVSQCRVSDTKKLVYDVKEEEEANVSKVPKIELIYSKVEPIQFVDIHQTDPSKMQKNKDTSPQPVDVQWIKKDTNVQESQPTFCEYEDVEYLEENDDPERDDRTMRNQCQKWETIEDEGTDTEDYHAENYLETGVMRTEQTSPIMLPLQETVKILQDMLFPKLDGINRSLQLVRNEIQELRAEFQTYKDASTSSLIWNEQDPPTLGQFSLPISDIEVFEDFDKALKNNESMKISLGNLMISQISQSKALNGVQCVSHMLRSVISKNVATKYTGQQPRNGKKNFSLTNVGLLLKIAMKNLPQFRDISNPEFLAALGRSLTIAKQWKTWPVGVSESPSMSDNKDFII